MGDLLVTRWRRYGNDRLYVNDEAGQRVGWVDLLTGQETLEQPEYADAFHSVIATHQSGAATKVPGPGDTIASPRASVPSPRPRAEPTWVDLANNRPGQGIRELAETQSSPR